MRAFHDSRQAIYRQPYGAVPVGTDVTLSLDVWEDDGAAALCRTWVDGVGETLFPMERTRLADRLRFTCVLPANRPDLIWYSFILTGSDGVQRRYGAREGRVGGEGQLLDWEPPSFQLTVYRPRPLPDWYRNAVVYQIFPDRYCRGEDWKTLAGKALSKPRKGPARRLEADWEATPFYERDETGRVTAWDFYGGTLSGIREKLPHLRELGVTALYLNPIFEAASNHRYDTGDYRKIDPMLGDEEAFTDLALAAEEAGISLILDGVFNHTGCDSRYFNKYGNYDTLGAYQSEDSPYRDWYRFDDSPAGYDCWWGVDDLPNLEETAPGYQDLIYRGEDSVVRRWLKAGAKGWRLDVADELPDEVIAGIKATVTDTLGKDGLVIGEVWEDASHKVSYDKLRRYLLGDELDGVMNYPLRDAVHGYLLGRTSAPDLRESLTALQENYPREAFYGSLNLMGSHDRPRLMTLMGEAPDPASLTEAEKRDYRLPDDKRGLAKGRIWLATLLQMTLPGVPCIYYGDEAGLEGYADPYNRGTFPWGKEDKDLETIYRSAIGLRKLSPVFTDGDFTPFAQGDDVFGFLRTGGADRCAVAVNRSLWDSPTVTLPLSGKTAVDLVNGSPVACRDDGTAEITLRPMGSAVVFFRDDDPRLGAPMPRGAGVLCHITSLPNDKGPGNIGRPARDFIDFLAAAGQKYWQILPLNPTDEHGSPYAGASAFAANPALLPEGEAELRAMFKAFQGGPDYEAFCEKNKGWLEPYTLFTALKKKHKFQAWQDWPKADRTYPPQSATDPAVRAEAAFLTYCQYRFHVLWTELRAYAKEKGVAIIGDLPMYVSADSADVWAERDLFTVDAEGRSSQVAGVPPDYFAKEGQLWGNPLYNWDRMRADGYDWWMRRLARVFDLYDYVRLDHFRGFESYWSIPAGEKATAGRWVFGPGTDLFRRARDRFGPLPVLAEDLGSLTPAVRGLVDQCGFPGTDVVQFYDGDPLAGYQPPAGKVAYTGTHDNQTLLGWCGDRYPDLDPAETAEKLKKTVLASAADVVILPLQDVLGLGDEARMNTPGTVGTNWAWQADQRDMKGAAARLLALTNETDRS